MGMRFLVGVMHRTRGLAALGVFFRKIAKGGEIEIAVCEGGQKIYLKFI